MNSGISFMVHHLSHFFRARSNFDIHSPFVYRLYSGVIKDRSEYPEYKSAISFRRKECRLLFRLTRYFGPSDILITGLIDEPTVALLKAAVPVCTIHEGGKELRRLTRKEPFDMILMQDDDPDAVNSYFPMIMQQIREDSVLIFQNIYKLEKNLLNWRTAKAHPLVSVSLDLFHLGILIFRKELSREEYILRF